MDHRVGNIVNVTKVQWNKLMAYVTVSSKVDSFGAIWRPICFGGLIGTWCGEWLAQFTATSVICWNTPSFTDPRVVVSISPVKKMRQYLSAYRQLTQAPALGLFKLSGIMAEGRQIEGSARYSMLPLDIRRKFHIISNPLARNMARCLDMFGSYVIECGVWRVEDGEFEWRPLIGECGASAELKKKTHSGSTT